MNPQNRQRIEYLVSTVRNYALLLIVPAVIGLVLASFYAFFIMPEKWTARQSFLIRDDLSGSAFKPGRFDSEESRKSAQETVLEIARRPLVVRSVLKELGPESFVVGSNWISDEIIEDTQKTIDISAPNGAEFGKTDAIVLTAKASSRDRTRKFIELLSEEIIAQTNRVRSLRFESMEMESDLAYKAAVQARDEAIDRLNELDQRLGSDFGFLSVQGSQTAGVEAIKSEILRKQDELEKAEAVFAALLQAFNNPETAAQLPSEVLVAQPTLEKTMSKLLDLREQLHLAKGLFSDKHARVRGITKAIEFAQEQLYDSLTGEMAGVQGSIKLTKQQLTRLNDRIEELKSRLVRLSKSRSEHLALTTQVQQLGEAANLAKSAWTEIRSRTKAARMVGLLTPTDVAQVNSRPDGIGKKFYMLAGLLGGLMVGTGLVFAVAPPMEVDPADVSRSTTASNPPNKRRHELQQGTSNSVPVGNSVTNESFQHAAFAMQSAADAMQLAAVAKTPTQQTTSSPTQILEPQQQQRTAASKAQKHPTTVVANETVADTPSQRQSDAARVMSLGHSGSSIPRDTRSQPVGNRKQTTPANTQYKNPPANVRPVDLAKSASEDNEFVRVNTDSTITPPIPSEENNPQQENGDASIPKSGRVIADTVLSERSQQHHPASPNVMSDEGNNLGAKQVSNTRPLTATDPFVVTTDGETPSQSSGMSSQDFNDAIPTQIRKLSESIIKFGKDKFENPEE